METKLPRQASRSMSSQTKLFTENQRTPSGIMFFQRRHQLSNHPTVGMEQEIVQILNTSIRIRTLWHSLLQVRFIMCKSRIQRLHDRPVHGPKKIKYPDPNTCQRGFFSPLHSSYAFFVFVFLFLGGRGSWACLMTNWRYFR